MNADMQRGGCAHRMADDMRLVDLERIHHRDDVVAEMVLAIFAGAVWNIRGRITALAISDTAVRAGEMAHLRLPRAPIAGIFMHEDDGRALARFLDIQPDTVTCCNMRHHALHSSADIDLHAKERGVKSGQAV